MVYNNRYYKYIAAKKGLKSPESTKISDFQHQTGTESLKL